MKHFFPVVPAILAILFGSILVLQLLAWASLQDPRLEGVSYYLAVLGKLFGPRTTWVTILGAVCVMVGLSSILHSVFLAGSDGQERREAQPVFWTALGLCTAGVLLLLITVNYLSLQAGEVRTLSWWFSR